MGSMSESRRARLEKLLANEAAKTSSLSKQNRKPSQFRETALHTHESLPAYDFTDKGAAVLAEKQATRRTANAGRRASQHRTQGVAHGNSGMLDGGPHPLETARPHYSRMQGMEHGARINSEWALLDTLQVEMANLEYEQRKGAEREQRKEQRKYLDKQMLVVEEQRAMEKAAKEAERTMVIAAVEKNARDVLARNAINREKNMKVAREMQKARDAAKAKKDRNLKMKMLSEQEELRDIKEGLEMERRKKEEEKEEHKKAVLQTLEENSARIAAKAEAKAKEAKEDIELMEKTLRTLEAQELEREQKLKDFHESIEKRGALAGEMVVADRAEREAKEMANMIKAQREAAEKEEADRAARAKALAQRKMEVARARDAQMALREARKEKEKADLRAYVEAVKREDAISAEDEAEKQAIMAAARHATAAAQVAQINHKHEADALDDIFMTEREREINAAALHQAERHVEYPHIIPLKF